MRLDIFALWNITRLKLQFSVPSLFLCVVVCLIIKLEKATILKSMFLKNALFLLFLLTSLIFDKTNTLDSTTFIYKQSYFFHSPVQAWCYCMLISRTTEKYFGFKHNTFLLYI